MLAPNRPHKISRRGGALRVLVYLLAFVVPPTFGAGLSVLSHLSPPGPGPTFEEELPTSPAHDPTKLTAVILAGTTGAESIDLLTPYELLASSGAFNVYTLAPVRDVLPLFPASPQLQGVHFVPHYSFEGYAASVGVQPDLVVVPWIPADETPATGQLRDWLREHATSETMLLTICGGSWTAAQAGLLDGYAATSHQNILPMVGSGYPATTWIDGGRWVHDRHVVSSAGITAAVDATLHVISEMVGRDVAEDVARRLGYPHLDYLDDPRYDVPARDNVLRNLNLAFRWERTHIGLVLYDGVGEIEVASIVDLHPRTYSNVIHPLTLGDQIVETRHGLHLVARRDVAGLDRIVLPGEASSQLRRSAEAWAREMGLPVDNVHGDGFAFDAALHDIAEHSSHAEARLVATGAEYPGQIRAMTGSGWPWALVLRPLLLGAAGIATASAVGAARRHRQTGPAPRDRRAGAAAPGRLLRQRLLLVDRTGGGARRIDRVAPHEQLAGHGAPTRA